MAGMLQMRRSRGAFSGFLLILLGLWGALIPFIGPYLDFRPIHRTRPGLITPAACGWNSCPVPPSSSAASSSWRPGAGTPRCSAPCWPSRPRAWFVLGQSLSPLWNNHVAMGGSPASSTQYMRIMEQLGFFTALGVVIVFVAGAALGRIASVASGIRPGRRGRRGSGDHRPGGTGARGPYRPGRHRSGGAGAGQRRAAPARTRMEPVATRTESRAGQAQLARPAEPDRGGPARPGRHRDRRVRHHPVRHRSACMPLSSARHIRANGEGASCGRSQ